MDKNNQAGFEVYVPDWCVLPLKIVLAVIGTLAAIMVAAFVGEVLEGNKRGDTGVFIMLTVTLWTGLFSHRDSKGKRMGLTIILWLIIDTLFTFLTFMMINNYADPFVMTIIAVILRYIAIFYMLYKVWKMPKKLN